MSDVAEVVESAPVTTDAPAGSAPTTEPAVAAAPQADAPTSIAQELRKDRDTGTPPLETAKNEPPRERWESILANARKKEREAAANEYRQKYGWAEAITPQEFQEVQQFARNASQNPLAAAQELLNHAKSDPANAAALRQLASQLMPEPPKAREVEDDAEPQPDLQTAEGQLLYSAQQQRAHAEWLVRQTEQRFSARLKPFEERAAKAEEAERQAAAKAEADTQAGSVYESVQKFPHFEAHKDAIKAKFAQMDLGPDASMGDVKAALFQCYIDVLATDVLPTLEGKAQTELLQSLKTKAAASSRVPGSPSAVGTPPKPTRFSDALREVRASR